MTHCKATEWVSVKRLMQVSYRVRLPHGGVRPFHQKSTCLTQSTSGPHVVQIWLHNTLEFRENDAFELHRVDPEPQDLNPAPHNPNLAPQPLNSHTRGFPNPSP